MLKTVFPERMKKKDKGYRDRWWQYARQGKDLYQAIKTNKKVLVRTQASKHNFVDFVEIGYVYDQKLVVFKDEDFVEYSFLNSTIHDIWAGKLSGDFGGIPNYSPSRIYETFPFITNKNEFLYISELGYKYYTQRRAVINILKQGLTQVYNLFHAKDLTISEIQKTSKQDEANCKKAFDDITKLRELHKQMDEAVLGAYVWSDIQLLHDFYEVDYLPENDRVRFTIHPDARKEVLKRLLELNHKIHEEEVAASLLEVKPAKKSKKKETNPSQNELF